jgi:hypothetical protein
MSVARKGVWTALVAVVCAVALLAGAGSALAETKTFEYTGEEQKFEVPAGVTSVEIEAAGAQGGPNEINSRPGGKGARLVATFPVTAGETLNVLVGGRGVAGGSEVCEGGGGGGSFVDTSATSTGLLLAAAGGGAAGYQQAGSGGSATEEAAKGGGADGGAAGTHGNGGVGGGGLNPGAGGGGLLTPGGTTSDAHGGKSLVEGGAGGACDGATGSEGHGGFGGGGGGGLFIFNHGGAGGAGGGGGFNGGGGGGAASGAVAGGGGGSFSASTPSVTESGVHTGDGLVTFTYTSSVPTNKQQCKKGGWRKLTDSNGKPFKNQGQCVKFVNANKTPEGAQKAPIFSSTGADCRTGTAPTPPTFGFASLNTPGDETTITGVLALNGVAPKETYEVFVLGVPCTAEVFAGALTTNMEGNGTLEFAVPRPSGAKFYVEARASLRFEPYGSPPVKLD